ncbi:hypothetical protein KDW_64220 [Dictyobacter vulcani]|uniref:Uncharacterized protein n=1 Tax=Dictyobacter vulcani TaxID=2607529 RepID=A0A5J4L0B5_9CHLR|nr:zf-HC2 domain-containing protein [Dictyobacter vulcani]GER92260.1 hypothetical protein KDW_64220 [Dictyobacter vulcani]
MNKFILHDAEPTCTAISELLDAYSTNEVSIQEQQQVEQHLSSCQHCQQRLAEIHWLRKMLLETEPVVQDATPARPTSNLADAVIANLQKNAAASSQISTPVVLAHKRRTVSKRWQRPLLLLVAAICLVLAGTFLLDYMQYQPAIKQAPGGPSVAKQSPSIISWTTQPDQDAISNRDGFFSLLGISINKEEYGFFYVYRANQGTIRPRLTVTTYQTDKPRTLTNLPTSIQVLGHVGPYEAGYIYAPATDHVQQHVMLRAFKPGQTSVAWQLTPLIQIMPISHMDSSWTFLYVDQKAHPEIQWTGPIRKQAVSLIKYTPTGARKASPIYMFFLGKDSHTLRIITKEDYLKLAGPENFF